MAQARDDPTSARGGGPTRLRRGPRARRVGHGGSLARRGPRRSDALQPRLSRSQRLLPPACLGMLRSARGLARNVHSSSALSAATCVQPCTCWTTRVSASSRPSALSPITSSRARWHRRWRARGWSSLLVSKDVSTESSLSVLCESTRWH